MTLQVHYDAREGLLLVKVSDHGTWRHVDPADQPNTRGRGIPLMRALADDTTISRTANGTACTCGSRIAPGSARRPSRPCDAVDRASELRAQHLDALGRSPVTDHGVTGVCDLMRVCCRVFL